VLGHVSHGALLAVCATYDLIVPWEIAKADAGNVAISIPNTTINKRGLAAAALRVLDRGEGLDLGDPDTGPMLDAMVAFDLMSSTARTALDTKASTMEPRHKANGIDRVKIGIVARARNG